MKTFTRFIFAASCLFCLTSKLVAQQSYIIPVGSNQTEYLNAYKYVLKCADADFSNTGNIPVFFTKYSETSVYRAISGTNAGSFVVSDAIPTDFSNVSNTTVSSYNWNTGENLSVQFKRNSKKIGIFKSQYLKNGNSISWESLYFTDLLNTYLFSDCYFVFGEKECKSTVSDSTDLIIIPAFSSGTASVTEYIDSVVNESGSALKKYLNAFLAKGGVIYTEGNAAYLLEALNILASKSIDYTKPYQPGSSGIIEITATGGNPLSLSSTVNGNKMFSATLPTVTIPSASIAAKLKADDRPVIFSVEGSTALGGKIICNLGLPLVQGLYDATSKRQVQYSLDAIVYAFSKKVDVTRSVQNKILGVKTAIPDNTIAFDRIDTFDIKIIIRNLSNSAVSNISIIENIPSYFKFISSSAGSFGNNKLSIDIASLGGNTEQVVTYKLCTPDPNDPIHDAINKSIIGESLLNTSNNTTSYKNENTIEKFTKNKANANAVFCAHIVADADVNWKNFLGTYFQPFKVFAIMENKERTPAEQTQYVQFIPRDVPFYQSDNSINIPILKTPGGKFIDVLKGVNVGLANKSNSPIANDFDADGDPDVWLDTASIYPKNYTIKDTMVYWANPWNHLRTGKKDIVFEDINHDGIIASADSTGKITQEAVGDKIHVWKVTWPIGSFPGNQYYDPYSSYELWIDAPDLVALAAGVGFVNDSVKKNFNGMYYPYTKNIATASKSDTTWKHWMDYNKGNVEWKQFIHQKINNYLGYAFIDTIKENYRLRPYDSLIGTTPQPHNEFIAVVSLGGEEIDMTHPTPASSMYSNVKYKTILGEDRTTPIRTTYTYYAPLPNPLQFEYLSSSFTLTDSTGKQTQILPKRGKAKLQYKLEPSTEYTYYWIRGFGYPVKNSPLKKYDGLDGLGDGVFGYLIYDIPKGMGGYSITLPRKADGNYDTEAIVQVEGNHPFVPLIDNPNTPNKIEIWEDAFQYHVYIPQLLIPPALDDDNKDGKDDWWDDKGDRFKSETGFLHDAFMPGDGDTIASEVAHNDFGYGNVTTGWSRGADGTYGDDIFENLGKTSIIINAEYEGKGREGNVDISKGGTFVCEEIFGGSPWVISSHVHSAFAQGAEYEIVSKAIPSTIKFGGDTVFIKHEISDKDEPHYFNAGFDPYIQSFGYADASINSIAGGKDPCSFVSPDITTHSIIDPAVDKTTVTVYPNIPASTKTVTSAFLNVKVEVNNLSDDNWKNVKVTPVLTNAGGASAEVQYVAYPRPLVPNDQIGTMTTGWRFNQPEGEVVVKQGNTMYEIQPTRRAYFVFLFKIPAMAKGIYEIGFTINGQKVHYTGENKGEVNYSVPSVKFSIVNKNTDGSTSVFSPMVIGAGKLDTLFVPTANFKSLNTAKWSATDVGQSDFNSMKNTLVVSTQGSGEAIDLSKLKTLPNADTAKLYILEKGIVTVKSGSDSVLVANKSMLRYKNSTGAKDTAISNPVSVMPFGPFVTITNSLYSINGQRVLDTLPKNNGEDMKIVSVLNATNIGNSPSYNSNITLFTSAGYDLILDSIKSKTSYEAALVKEGLNVKFGSITPGETRQILVYYKLKSNLEAAGDLTTLINQSNVSFNDKQGGAYNYIDPVKLKIYVFEFAIDSISYNANGEKLVNVSAQAINYGVEAKNVWFRIYPVINGGLREFPIAEIKIEDFKSGQIVPLTGQYLVPDGQKVEFVAVIDDNKEFSEILKSNNEKNKLYQSEIQTNVNIAQASEFSVFPNPANDKISIKLQAESGTQHVIFAIYNLGGVLVSASQMPVAQGKVSGNIDISQLASGAYIYKAYTIGNKTTVFSGNLIKK